MRFKMDKITKTGLGGWLILVGIGVIFGPIILSVQFVTVFVPIFTNGTIEAISSKGNELYVPLLGPLIYFETAVNAVFILFSFYSIYLFFWKKIQFPRVYILLLVGSLTFLVLDAYVTKIIFPNELTFDRDTIVNMFRGVISACIWVPYLIKSKRVKGTFIN